MGPYLILTLHTIMIIVIIVTIMGQPNGVSFELVAGACCAVYFSNMMGPTSLTGGGLNQNPSFKPTLNINSTGAKSMRSASNSLTWGTVCDARSHDNRTTRQVIQNSATSLLCTYTGSEYLSIGALGGKTSSYSDYQD